MEQRRSSAMNCMMPNCLTSSFSNEKTQDPLCPSIIRKSPVTQQEVTAFQLTLQVMYDHQSPGITRNRHVFGVVDVVGLRPDFDDDHERAHPPVQLCVTIQQASVLNADHVVTIQIDLETGFFVFKF
jgi:hypothetical protein